MVWMIESLVVPFALRDLRTAFSAFSNGSQKVFGVCGISRTPKAHANNCYRCHCTLLLIAVRHDRVFTVCGVFGAVYLGVSFADL